MNTISRRGFTLIEVLLVIGIIAILASIVIVAINPTRQLADARNADRRSDVNSILNAVYQYSIDNNGNLPSAITTTVTEICASGAASCTGYADLSVLEATYLVSVPSDPSGPTSPETDYTIVQDANGRVTVASTAAENGATISVTR
ncbi:hypothetical protein COU77_01965 [Candidatus Peregrinibacteria bacterium CG10_big_fil_rev_8_21_14_0_10_49_16]|nr:MAG: hypothetical protein COW95_02740 [Candidatus Peregrinibacteria bacterium CG22_combo_CG10-13_8_21_14_all_49_11]PIR52153.1 MAG: hypothetical protein COU77_01965 [Candidatus Peregrinibacteria bacterium CG10_big_fil_rev_8_21_14_0_10_49_16]